MREPELFAFSECERVTLLFRSIAHGCSRSAIAGMSCRAVIDVQQRVTVESSWILDEEKRP